MKITQDIHIHTIRSDGQELAEFYINNAAARGLDTIGFADHMWENGGDFGIASYKRHSANYDKIIKIKDDIAATTIPNGLRVFVGCETDFVSDSTLGISRDVAKLLDYVIIPHSHTHFPEVMPQELYGDLPEMAKFVHNSYMRMISHPDVDLAFTIAHPYGTSLAGTEKGDADLLRLIKDEQYREAFSRTAELGIGVEMNTIHLMHENRYTNGADVKNGEYYRMFAIAKECGCKFTFGSDAHSKNACDYFVFAEAMAKALELQDKDIKLL